MRRWPQHGPVRDHTRDEVETDHKPLVQLLGSKNLDSLPPLILQFRLRLARFDYEIVHVAGKLLYTSDTLFRAPRGSQDNNTELQQDAECFTDMCVLNLPITREQLLGSPGPRPDLPHHQRTLQGGVAREERHRRPSKTLLEGTTEHLYK